MPVKHTKTVYFRAKWGEISQRRNWAFTCFLDRLDAILTWPEPSVRHWLKKINKENTIRDVDVEEPSGPGRWRVISPAGRTILWGNGRSVRRRRGVGSSREVHAARRVPPLVAARPGHHALEGGHHIVQGPGQDSVEVPEVDGWQNAHRYAHSW